MLDDGIGGLISLPGAATLVCTQPLEQAFRWDSRNHKTVDRSTASCLIDTAIDTK